MSYTKLSANCRYTGVESWRHTRMYIKLLGLKIVILSPLGVYKNCEQKAFSISLRTWIIFRISDTSLSDPLYLIASTNLSYTSYTIRKLIFNRNSETTASTLAFWLMYSSTTYSEDDFLETLVLKTGSLTLLMFPDFCAILQSDTVQAAKYWSCWEHYQYPASLSTYNVILQAHVFIDFPRYVSISFRIDIETYNWRKTRAKLGLNPKCCGYWCHIVVGKCNCRPSIFLTG